MDKTEQFLSMYPKLNKWINQCVSCGEKGYKPEIPNSIYPWESVASKNLKKLFKPLILNLKGYCEICKNLLEEKIHE